MLTERIVDKGELTTERREETTDEMMIMAVVDIAQTTFSHIPLNPTYNQEIDHTLGRIATQILGNLIQ